MIDIDFVSNQNSSTFVFLNIYSRDIYKSDVFFNKFCYGHWSAYSSVSGKENSRLSNRYLAASIERRIISFDCLDFFPIENPRLLPNEFTLMYTRLNIVYHRIRSIRYHSSSNDEILFQLINHCHRKHFVHHDLLSKAIENIHSNLSEKQSMMLLNAAAQYIHHVTPDKRVELLEEVRSFVRKNSLKWGFVFRGLEEIQ